MDILTIKQSYIAQRRALAKAKGAGSIPAVGIINISSVYMILSEKLVPQRSERVSQINEQWTAMSRHPSFFYCFLSNFIAGFRQLPTGSDKNQI